jgi:transglutaminase-like putative cysteine protease
MVWPSLKPTGLIFLLLAALQVAGAPAPDLQEIGRLVNEGRWRQARRQIQRELAQPGLSFQAREALLFQQERLARIRLDFGKTRAEVLQEARQIVPDLNEGQFARWEKAGAVEFLDLDGQRWFFHRAAGNLFRINPEARAFKLKAQPGSELAPSYRLENIRQILTNYDRTGERRSTPRRCRVTYTLRVKPGAVPPGETVRAWLPYPQTGNRQRDIRLVKTEPPRFVLSDTPQRLAAVYLEKPALDRQPTSFQVCFEYTATGFHQPIDPGQVRPVGADHPELAPYLAEQAPHVVFSDALRKLSREIVAEETNPYVKARRLFQWVCEHIPWAGAREYSTLDSLPDYALACRHGDCGIQTMLFMALCRLNGIPARWESGWTTGPDKDMHDWCQIYLAPYGWVPVDVAYGLVASANEREKWFYLGGTDSFRLVVNTDHGQPLYPAKTHFRSELVDFQRGEAEWRGGNLYFDQWDWDFRVEEISPKAPEDVTKPAGAR